METEQPTKSPISFLQFVNLFAHLPYGYFNECMALLLPQVSIKQLLLCVEVDFCLYSRIKIDELILQMSFDSSDGVHAALNSKKPAMDKTLSGQNPKSFGSRQKTLFILMDHPTIANIGSIFSAQSADGSEAVK